MLRHAAVLDGRHCSTTFWPASAAPVSDVSLPEMVAVAPYVIVAGALTVSRVLRCTAYERSAGHCRASSDPTAQKARPCTAYRPTRFIFALVASTSLYQTTCRTPAAVV